MKTTIALLATLMMATGALAERRHGSASAPFSREEARVMSAAWPTIREAGRYEDIDWRSVGLSRAPGDGAARDLMSDRWGSIRQAASFRDIDWTAEYRATGDSGDYRGDSRGSAGPFSPEEADAMRKAWPKIRDAAEFDDIDWRTVGLRRAPGDSSAQRMMARNWGEMREAASFDDIDWRATAGYRLR